jgi:hypothetical protein
MDWDVFFLVRQIVIGLRILSNGKMISLLIVYSIHCPDSLISIQIGKS